MNKKDYRGSSSTINYTNNTHADEHEYYPDYEYSPRTVRSSTNTHTSRPETNPSSTSNSNSNNNTNSNSNINTNSSSSSKVLSPDRKHRPSTSNVSVLGTPRTPRSAPRSSHDYLYLSPSRYPSPERPSTSSQSKHSHNRYPSIDYAAELSPFPYYSDRNHKSNLSSTSYDSLFHYPAIKSPTRTPRRNQKYVSFQEEQNQLQSLSIYEDEVYFREEDITPFPSYSRKSYGIPSNQSSSLSRPTSPPKVPKVTPSRSYYRRYLPPPPPPSSFYLPNPKRRRPMNTTAASTTHTMNSKLQENNPAKPQGPLPSSKPEQTSTVSLPQSSTNTNTSNSPHVIASDASGVEVVLKQEQKEEKNGPYSRIMRSGESKRGDATGTNTSTNTNANANANANTTTDCDANGNKNDTPQRKKNLDKGKKVNVISPPEGQNHGHNRSPSYNAADYADLPSVPDSPYNPFIPPHHSGYGSYPSHSHHSGHPYPYTPASPNKGGHKSIKNGPEERERERDRERDGHYAYSPHFGYPYPPPGYEDHYRDPSPGKRQRLNVQPEAEEQPEEMGVKQGAPYPHSDRYAQDPYQPQQHPYLSRWAPGSREDYAEAYDSSDQQSGHSRPKHGAAPPVSKASSYPPPPSSPGRHEAAADSSSASYPGARRSHGHASGHGASSDYSYGQMPHPSRGHGHDPSTNHQYDYHESGYYPDPWSHGRYPEMPSAAGPRGMYPNYYYHEGPPHEDVHPLLRDYNPEKDRRMHPASHDNAASEKQLSPDRGSTKADGESVATTPSLKSRSSKVTSPSKRKPSTAAKAAIAAGMTQPASAREVDFDIHNPPLEPIIPASADPVCSVTSNVNNNDVLCGRGGGTNTQIGNRRFRSLVQEFQPTYLLCRRKEKPLIARTIVLIIRHRGGRFLKKDDANGMLFEVGDTKAEAKTSQALREGLDVRASKSTTLMGRQKKLEAEEKSKDQHHQETAQPQEESSSQPARNVEQSGQGDDVTMSESPHRNQRDGPPPQNEYPPYHPPHYFYGYGSQYPPYHYGYETNPSYSSPSRKRQRSPPGEQMYYPPPHYNHKGYPSYSYPPEYHYPNYAPPPAQQNQTGEENSMWEMDFNPPRGSTKKEGVKREQ